MPIEETTSNTLRVLKLGGFSGIPVYRGSAQPLKRVCKFAGYMHGESGVGGCNLPQTEQLPVTEDVFAQIYAKIRSAGQKVYLIATACLTNIAILVQQFPDLGEYIEAVSFLGGAIGIGNTQPEAEFNAFCDPEAASIVFNSGLKIYQTPIETTERQLQVDEAVQGEIDSWRSDFGASVLGILNVYRDGFVKVFGFKYAIAKS